MLFLLSLASITKLLLFGPLVLSLLGLLLTHARYILTLPPSPPLPLPNTTLSVFG